MVGELLTFPISYRSAQWSPVRASSEERKRGLGAIRVADEARLLLSFEVRLGVVIEIGLT